MWTTDAGHTQCKTCSWPYRVVAAVRSDDGVDPGVVTVTLDAPLAPGDVLGSGLCSGSSVPACVATATGDAPDVLTLTFASAFSEASNITGACRRAGVGEARQGVEGKSGKRVDRGRAQGAGGWHGCPPPRHATSFLLSRDTAGASFLRKPVDVSGDRAWGDRVECLTPDNALGSLGFCVDDVNGANVFAPKGALETGPLEPPYLDRLLIWRDGTGQCARRSAVALCETEGAMAVDCAGWDLAPWGSGSSGSNGGFEGAGTTTHVDPSEHRSVRYTTSQGLSTEDGASGVWRVFETNANELGLNPIERVTTSVDSAVIEDIAFQCDFQDRTYTHTFSAACLDTDGGLVDIDLKFDSEYLLRSQADEGETIVGCDRVRLLIWTDTVAEVILLHSLRFHRDDCGANRYKTPGGLCTDCAACSVSPRGLRRVNCGKRSEGTCEMCPPDTKATNGFVAEAI